MTVDLTRLTDTTFTGGDLPDEEAAAIQAIDVWRNAGIGTVIDCRAEWSDEELVAEYAPHIRYVHLGIDDRGQRVPPEWFDSLVLAATPQSAEVASGVLVHCHMGINRGPSGAYALLLSEGHDPVEALDLIRARRPQAAVSYAEDALDWWLARTHADRATCEAQRGALAEWRRTHPLATLRRIRDQHSAE